MIAILDQNNQEHQEPMQVGSKALIICTSWQCHNRTTPHLYIGEYVVGGHSLGNGWYQCKQCGVYRQDIRCSCQKCQESILPNTESQ
jgi:hypothetical protein